ncbi:hypothetical protein [Paenibacillus aceris]|uniref:Uncharacterized protein n=1 Tax=Paenibacillus aceris TaxID=869555 RepID=A0ABS4I5Z5_9BACL|nr:hypothetical protein [Paenibacillus aceris]MBP1966334.1 hypothetical protein [Paenibacillus aceris]NHW38592.1 hypothetical protein [Paenibacillus aceris]
MKSRQSHKPRGRRKKVKKAVLQTPVTTGSSAGRAAREANLFATGIAGKYGFWRNNYLGLLALIFKQNGMSSRKQLAALTDTNDRAWIIQLELLLKSLQHPESAPLITKKQTIRQIEQLMTNAGYKIPALSHISPSPSDAAPTLLQAQGPAEKPVKKRGRKSKKQLEAEASVNHINHPDMIPQSPSEKRVKPALVNYVNKGSLPLINRSIGQIAASIGMVGSSRRNRSEQQSQAVSRHQHTTQNVNIQLKSIQLIHKSVIREKGRPSTAQAGWERSSKISHANVANHVEAVQRTSQLLERFQEGKPAVSMLERGTDSTSVGATDSAQPSVLQIAKLYLNDVARPHLVSKAQHQPLFEEDVATMSSPASSPKSLPKLGTGPFTAGNAPASVHFIKSLLVRNASQEAGASIDPMPPHHANDVRGGERQPKTSASKGFLAASQLPLAINASRITSTLPFAMHAATSLNARNEAWGGAPNSNSPRIWRKPQGQDQARADEQERVRVQEYVQDQHATQLHKQILSLQERVENQAEEAHRLDQANAQLHVQAQDQAENHRQETASDREQGIVQEQQRAREVERVQERAQEKQISQEKASVRDQELHSTAVQVRNQREVSWGIHAPNQVLRSNGQSGSLGAVSDEKTLIDGAADAQQRIRAKGNGDQSFVMERLAQHAVKPVSGQGITTFSGKETAFSPSKLTHRKLSAIESGIEAAVKIQSNEHTLKQLLQKQRQQSSNDLFVGSTYTNLTTHTPRMIRVESSQRKQTDTINDVNSTPSINFHPMNNSIQRMKTSSQTSTNGRQLEGVLKQMWGNQPEAGKIASSVPGVRYPKNITSEISAKMAGNNIIKLAASPIEGYRASVKASTRLHEAERIFRTPLDNGRGDAVSERQSRGQREDQDAAAVRGALPSHDLASEISAKIVESSITKIGTAFIQTAGMNTEGSLNRRMENGLENGLPGHPAKGIRASSLSNSSASGQRVERVFRSLAGPQGWGKNEPTDRTGKIAQTVQTAEIEQRAETAQASQTEQRAETGQASQAEQGAETGQASQTEQRAETSQAVQTAQTVSGKLITSDDHSKSDQLAEDVKKEARNQTRSSLSSGDFAAEIAAKITKNSLKSLRPSLAPAAAEIALLRSQQADSISREPYQGSAVRAIWRARQREASTDKVSVSGNEGRAASVKVDAGSAVNASDTPGTSQRASFEVARGIISQASSTVPMFRRSASSANFPRNEYVGNSVGQAALGNLNWIGRTNPNEIHRSMEAEARAKLHIQAGSAMQSRKQPVVEARRSAQVEHVQRQTIAAESERAQRARTGSGNQEEAGSFLSDSTERTIRASLSALEEARAQAEQPAAASQAAVRADARTTRAPVARQPASMTPRVMPLLASSAGARFAAPAGGAAASPAAAVHLLPAHGTGSITQAAAIGRAAAITAGAQHNASLNQSSSASLAAAGHTPLPTQVQRQLAAAGVSFAGAEGQSALQAGAPITLLLPGIGSRSATARQEHLASQPAALEHKQAPAGPAPQSALAEKPLEMDWLRTKESADQDQTPAAPIPQAAPELSSEQLQELMKQLPQLDVAKIADKVFREIEKRMKFERQRRGL